MFDICIYHANCKDGFTSAFIVWCIFKEKCKYLPYNYGKSPPDIKDLNVIICDFSFDYNTLKNMIETSKSLIVLDHHETSEKNLKDIPNQHKIFDKTLSGATLTWNYLNKDKPLPRFIKYIEDYDLWKFQYKETKYLNAVLNSLPFDFELYESLLDNDTLNKYLKEGEVIIRYQKNQLSFIIRSYEIKTFITNNNKKINIVYVQSNTLVNEIADYILKKEETCDIVCVVNYNYKYNFTKFHLRSKDINVAKIAEIFNGGGHKLASSFIRNGLYCYIN